MTKLFLRTKSRKRNFGVLVNKILLNWCKREEDLQRKTHWRDAYQGSDEGHTHKQEASVSHEHNNQTNLPHYGAAHVPTTLPR